MSSSYFLVAGLEKGFIALDVSVVDQKHEM